MTALIDITGQMFGKWKVIKKSNHSSVQTLWQCQCTCGRIKDVCSKHLRTGQSKQCRSCAGRYRKVNPKWWNHLRKT